MKRKARGESGRRVVLKTLCVLILLAVCLSFSIWIDPAGLLHAGSLSGTEMTAIGILQEGKSAAGLDNYNERLVKRTLATHLGAFDTIALGSSRAAMITAEMAGEESFFNLAVSGASLQDIIGIYSIYEAANGAPKRAILSLDPWVLNDAYPEVRYIRSLGDGYYRYATERLGVNGLDEKDYKIANMYADPGSGVLLSDLTVAEWMELLSVPYFQSAVRSLFSTNRYGGAVSETDETEGEFGILRSDGSYAYPRDYREADLSAIKGRAETQNADSMGNGEFKTCYGNNYGMLCDFFDSLIEDGVEIRLVMTPFNPVYYEMIETKTPGAEMLRAAEVFREIAAERGITIIGDFDPDALDAETDDFYDAYHYSAENVAALMSRFQEGEIE